MNAPTNKNMQTDRLGSSTSRTNTHRGQGLQFDERVSSLREKMEARTDHNIASIVRGDVKTGREFVKGWDTAQVSNNTQNRYTREFNNMKSNNIAPEHANCKATFEFQRAALVFNVRKELKEGLRDFDKFKRSGDLNKAAQSYLKIRECNQILTKYPPSTGNRAEDLKRESLYHGDIKSEKSNCKRDSVNTLPRDWKDKVHAQVNEKDKAAAAIMQLTGCRPIEARGVKVRQDADKSTVRVEIKGAKVDQDRVIPSRIVEFERDDLEKSQAGQDVLKWLGERQCRTTTTAGTLESFRERVNSAFDRADCSIGSCYSFRHEKATELRESGSSPAQIAATLGQRSEASQSVYGR